MARHRFKKEEHAVAEGEINLVPYLDIMVNLIMFMLLTFQVLAELKMISFNPPASGADTQIGDKPKDPEEKSIMLTVMITKGGYEILTTDENAGKEKIPFGAQGEHDYADLTTRLARIKKDVSNVDENLIVVADGEIIYDIVVKTLDATRTTPDGKDLFPKVTLGMAVGTQ